MLQKLITYYPEVATATILLLFFWWYIIYDTSLLGSLTKSLNRIASKFSRLSTEVNNVQKIEEILLLGKNNTLSNIWIEYAKDMENNNISEVFNPYDVILLTASRRKAEAIPSVLVALGIVSVFGGLVLGISNMPIAGEPAELIAYLIKTASEGLICGVIGVTLSIVYQILDRRKYHLALVALKNFCNKLNALLINDQIKKRQQIKIEHSEENNKTLKVIEGLAIEISRFTEEFSYKLQTVQRDGFKNLTQNFIEQLSSSTGNYIKELGSSYDKLSLAQKQSSEFITTFIDFSARSAEHQKQINKASEDAVANVVSATEKIAESAQITAAATEKTREFATLLVDILQSSMQNEQELASKFSDIIADMLEKLEGGINSNIDKTSEASVRLMEELDNRVFSINVYSDVISKEIAGLNIGLNKSVDTFTTQMNGSINNAFKLFDNSIADICDRLGTTAAAIRDSVEELPKLLCAYSDKTDEGQAGSDEK